MHWGDNASVRVVSHLPIFELITIELFLIFVFNFFFFDVFHFEIELEIRSKN